MNANSLGVVAFLVLFLTACQTTLEAPANLEKPLSRTITDQRLPEISGLATSNILPWHLWAINDSGNSASIYLIDQNLSIKQDIQLKIKNRDWEDLATFSADGEAWVVIAETGDNLLQYDEYQLYFYRESDLLNAANNIVSPKVRLSFTYPQGSINSEAIAVDVSSDSILLFGKTSDNTPVYRIALSAMHSTGPANAQLLASIPAFASSPATRFIHALTGVNLNATTSATIANDGRSLFLLTYNDIWRIDRQQSQSWADAIHTKVEHFSSHELHQAEALASDSIKSRLLLSSEKLPAPVLVFHY